MIRARRLTDHPQPLLVIELEEIKERLSDEILEVHGKIEELQKKAVNATSLEGSLTTFRQIYANATSEEQGELMKLHLNQLVWTPEEIRLALFDPPDEGIRTNVQRELINGGGGSRTHTLSARPINTSDTKSAQNSAKSKQDIALDKPADADSAQKHSFSEHSPNKSLHQKCVPSVYQKTAMPDDLAKVIEAWDKLSQAVKAGILAMIGALQKDVK